MSALTDSMLSYVMGATNEDGQVIFGGYTPQFSEWDESAADPLGNYVVIQNQGGAKAKPWFREPNYRIAIVTGRNDSFGEIEQDASDFIEYVRANYQNDNFALIETISDIGVIGRTSEGRPITDVTLRTFTKR